jgi:hypothetical protein
VFCKPPLDIIGLAFIQNSFWILNHIHIMHISGGRSIDRYIFFSIPIGLEKEMIPVAYGQRKGLVGQMKIRELKSASNTEFWNNHVLAA